MRTIRRRRKQNRTDYKSRLALLKSNKHRLVLRKTNKYIKAQIVETDVAQDKVLFNVDSKFLLNKGWPKEKEGSLKSVQAAYLTGFLLGKMAKQEGDLVLDIGLNRNVVKSRLYAVLKGCLDAGLKISHKPEILPTQEDLEKNENLKSIFVEVKANL